MAFLEASAAVFLLIIFKVLTMRAAVPLVNELNRTLSEKPKVEVSIKSDSIPELEKMKNEMEARKYILENIMSSRTYTTARLEDIAKLLPENMWLSELRYEEKVDKKNVSKITRYLNLKGYYLINERLGDKGVVDNFLTKLKEAIGLYNGMAKADIVSVKRMEMEGKKVANFEIVFTGP